MARGVAQGTVEVVPGVDHYRLDLQLSTETLELRGILVDAAGAPVAARPVHIHMKTGSADGSSSGSLWHSTATTADGSFLFVLSQARRYLVEVCASGVSPVRGPTLIAQEVDVPQSQPVRLVLPPD